MKIIPYIIYLLLVGLHTVVIREETTVYTASINLPVLTVMLVALYKSELTALWFGFLAGIVVSAGAPGMIGWYGLIYGVLGLIAYHVRERLNLESLNAKLLLVLGGSLLANVILLMMGGFGAFFYRLLTVALAGAVYTTVVGWLFFLPKEGIVTLKKIKAIF